MEFVPDESAFAKGKRGEDEGRYVRGNWILWLAVIAVLAGLNLASWSFCIWVFGQPEVPMNYRLLTRLDKLEPIHGFTPSTAPRGKFHSAKGLYSQVYPFGETERKAYNGILKRHYLRNYAERDDAVYLGGEFEVLSSRKLEEGDAFPAGLVVLGRAVQFPDGLVELVLPSEETPEALFEKGTELRIEESATCAAVLHVHREGDTMTFTAVPLVEREFPVANGKTIQTKTLPTIQLGDGYWPVMKAGEEEETEESDGPAEDGGKAEADSEAESGLPEAHPLKGKSE